MDDGDPAAEARVGTVLDEKWTLERILGSGGMGAVYAARHRNGARAAVKVLHPELARRPDVRERFLREGYAANRVEHRGAVQVLDDDVVKDGPDAGTAYIVMELLEGRPLEDRMEKEDTPLTEPELLEILEGVLDVLEAAHEHGVVHRDLKPANLFLTASGDPLVKVLDFGLARIEEVRGATSAGLALGTPSFMSPEQASGRIDEIDARTDIFAVGATGFMALSGRGVHEGDNLIELVVRMGTEPAPKLRTLAPQVSEAVASIIDRACAFDRADRYPSARAMRDDVSAALDAFRRAGRLSTRQLEVGAPQSSVAPVASPRIPPPLPVAPAPEAPALATIDAPNSRPTALPPAQAARRAQLEAQAASSDDAVGPTSHAAYPSVPGGGASAVVAAVSDARDREDAPSVVAELASADIEVVRDREPPRRRTSRLAMVAIAGALGVAAAVCFLPQVRASMRASIPNGALQIGSLAAPPANEGAASATSAGSPASATTVSTTSAAAGGAELAVDAGATDESNAGRDDERDASAVALATDAGADDDDDDDDDADGADVNAIASKDAGGAAVAPRAVVARAATPAAAKPKPHPPGVKKHRLHRKRRIRR